MLDIVPSQTTPRFAFGPDDAVHIDGVAYRAIQKTEDGWIFVRVDGTGVAEACTHTELARHAQLGAIRHVRDGLLPEGARQRLAAPAELLSTLSAEQHREVRIREASVLAFLDCEREGGVKRTDAAIKAALADIQIRAGRYLAQPSSWAPDSVTAGCLTIPKLSPRTLRRRVKAYEELGLSGLCGATGNRGNRTRRLRPEEISVMNAVVNGYLDDRKPSKAKVYDDVKARFELENRSRKAAGQTALAVPSRETVRQAINALDPLRCAFAREGREVVRNRDAPVGRGLELTRPLQRVEMDTYIMDLSSLMATAGLFTTLSDEDKAILGLDGKKGRWRITLALCATTRCILAMKLCRAPGGQTTLQTVDMMLRDKGVWTDAVSALSAWDQFGTPEAIVTDCGSEFITYDVRLALRDLGIRVENAPAGEPRMRARVERLFRTVGSGLAARLTGRTFGNMLEKGDYDPQAKAALTTDDVCEALIRWVVDVYHNTPHAGLGGETPARCWARLVETYGVGAPPDMRRRRMALGTRLSRIVQTTGITIWGVRYHSETLARWCLHNRDRKVEVRWYPEDIGAICVELDGEWIEVPAVFERFAGVRAQTWRAAARQLRAQSRHDATYDQDTVFEALRAIDAINDHAMARIGLLADDWSKEKVDREEDLLFLGFDCVATRRAAPPAACDTPFGEEIVPPADAGAPAPLMQEVEEVGEAMPPASPDAAPDAASDDGSGWEIEDDP